jgi:DNA topoisomerase-1
LAIPPAFGDVWIAPHRDNYLLARATDSAGRYQYRYHPVWQEYRSARKYEALPQFGRFLPRLRKQVRSILSSADVEDEDFPASVVVALLDEGGIRVGRWRHFRDSGTRGAVTLLRSDVDLGGEYLRLTFQAKGGMQRNITLDNPHLIAAIAELVESNDAGHLFEGACSLTATTINDWLDAAGMPPDCSAKTFRTWIGSVAATEALKREVATISAISEAAAKQLGNTPTIARNAYIHPAVIEAARSGWRAGRSGPTRLRVAERELMDLMERKRGEPESSPPTDA